jgi:hypothetical protein
MAGYHYHASTGPAALSHHPRSTSGRLPLGDERRRLPEQEGKKLLFNHFLLIKFAGKIKDN